ncbi:MAG: TolC family protein [Flavobacteriaceae bacterium]|jgi:outer membrane protein TolC|nr:TolC family protein [Flavobacteriaceae bacterium]
MSKSNYILLATFFAWSLWAQEPDKKPLTINQAIGLCLENSKEIKKASTATEASRLQINSAKNLYYPKVELSGTFLHLFSGANVNLKVPLPTTSTSATHEAAAINPEYMAMAQANASMPLFSGFKIRNAVKQSQQVYEMAELNAQATTENAVWETINLYFALYKTQRSIEILKENHKRAIQRTKDLQNFLDNGLIARNDFLRAQLQEANVQLSLQETETAFKNINMRLNSILELPLNEKIDVQPIQSIAILPNTAFEVTNRKDVQRAEKSVELAQRNIQINRSNYYPSLALTGGYMAFQLDKVMEMTNATMVGLGLKYDLTSIFKNRTEVNIAKAKKQEADYQLQLTTDHAQVDLQEAFNNYELTIQKNAVLSKALLQANENYRIVKDKYDNGLADTDQLLEADVQQLQAQINSVVGETDQTLSLYQYAYKKGNLTEYIEK